MKLIRTLFLVCSVAVFAAAAHADTALPKDPVIKTGGGDPPVPAIIVTPQFTISSASGASPATSPCVLQQGNLPPNPSPDCFFENGISHNGVGLAITQLVFDVGGLTPSTVVSCGLETSLGVGPFAECTPGTANASGMAQVTFFHGSIPFQTDFSLEFGTPTDSFPPNTSFGTTARTVPEPGTLALLLGGVGALLTRRRSLV